MVTIGDEAHLARLVGAHLSYLTIQVIRPIGLLRNTARPIGLAVGKVRNKVASEISQYQNV